MNFEWLRILSLIRNLIYASKIVIELEFIVTFISKVYGSTLSL